MAEDDKSGRHETIYFIFLTALLVASLLAFSLAAKPTWLGICFFFLGLPFCEP